MRFLSYHANGASTFGVVRDGGVVDVGARLPEVIDLGALLVHDRLDDARSIAEHHEPEATEHLPHDRNEVASDKWLHRMILTSRSLPQLDSNRNCSNNW